MPTVGRTLRQKDKMATPEEIYNSDTYKSVAEGRQGNHVPLAWFQDVYEALGTALTVNCVGDHDYMYSTNIDECPLCKQSTHPDSLELNVQSAQQGVQRTEWQCPPPCSRWHNINTKACVVCNSPRR